MNIAVVFAGGTGQRMNTKSMPKQFLELHGKPILVYTLEQFQRHPLVDGIVLVMLNNWISYSQELIERYRLQKVTSIVPGGKCGQDSIFQGLQETCRIYGSESVVLIHDGVRPLIDEHTITKSIHCTEQNGSAIVVSPAVETIALKAEEGKVGQVLQRSLCQIVKAPQCFRLKEILKAHNKAQDDNKIGFIDSASLMQAYGHPLHTVECTSENIKITTPEDFYIFRAIIDSKENSQIFGI